MNKVNKIKISLSLIYLIGFFGLYFPNYRSVFAGFTPINICLLLISLIYLHVKWNLKNSLSLIVIALLGFFVEVIGVKTGFPFGSYFYDKNLGPKFFDVPVLIGLNWAMLVYCSTYISKIIIKNKLIISLFASFLMLLFDIVLEQFAIRFKLWNWNQSEIPISNFIAWFIIAFVFNYFWVFISNMRYKNNIATFIFIIQIAFFSLFIFLGDKID